MDEPLICWICLILAMAWGLLTASEKNQNLLKQRFGKLTPMVQWYNVTFFLLTLFLIRTTMDIVTFEYFKDHFLSWDMYKNTLNPNITGIPLSEAELNIHSGPLVIPSFLRWLSLISPMLGLAAFVYSAYQVIMGIVLDAEPSETPSNRFLHMVVLGMPLVYIVMALRAMIREWAVMTGSCWLPYSHDTMTLQQKQDKWSYLKAAEISTYTQDLEIASGFQFFAVWCFGQVCSQALKNVLLDQRASNSGNNNAAGGEPGNRWSRGLSLAELRTAGITKDGQILLQLGIVGIHAFVILGVLKTAFNMIIAVASLSEDLKAFTEPIQQQIFKTLDPVFLFATILSVVNMLLLGQMDKVKEILPGINTKFNATRALLLIGQGQLALLRAATTDSGMSKILFQVHKVSFLKHLKWTFNHNQARLLHASLLCIECLAVVVVNNIAWHPTNKSNAANARETPAGKGAEEAGDPRRAPLLLNC